MIRFVRSVSTLVLGGFLAFAPGCGGSGGSGGGGNGGGGGSSDATSSTGETTASGATCAVTCSTGEECASLSCECSDGSVVNTSACNNSCCATEAEACPGSCEDHGGWGSGTSASTGSGASGASFGADCSSDSECQSDICFYVDPNDDSVQKCTKTCSFGGGDCDAGWFCAEINGGDKYLCLVQ